MHPKDFFVVVMLPVCCVTVEGPVTRPPNDPLADWSAHMTILLARSLAFLSTWPRSDLSLIKGKNTYLPIRETQAVYSPQFVP